MVAHGLPKKMAEVAGHILQGLNNSQIKTHVGHSISESVQFSGGQDRGELRQEFRKRS
jgi:hypothetical protein